MADKTHDTIYIDVEDDITSIIGKVKAAKQADVSLVPPKRIGALQSAVNLRLLQRAATQSEKKIALITANPSLGALAAAASIPTAKNLHETPEIAAAATPADETSDVIDGSELSVGEHAAQQPSARERDETRSAAMAAALAGADTAPAATNAAKKAKKSPRVPNFDTFRKKLILIGLGLLLLIAFFIWSAFIAPHATITITAKTDSESVNVPVRLLSTADTDSNKDVIHAQAASESEDASVEITPTGKKDVGKKATGVVTFSSDSISTLRDGKTIPAGTTLTSESGKEFSTDSSVTLTLQNNSDSTGITAAKNGSSYNGAEGAMTGAPDGISARLNDPTSGGVSKFVKVVTESDVQKAKQELVDQADKSKADSLKKEFDGDMLTLDDSFRISYDNVKSDPAIGEKADSATLTAKVTYTLYAVSRDEISKYLEASMQKRLKEDERTDQRIYDSGSKEASFQEVKKVKDGASATLVATVQVGPKIDDEQVKERSHGKRYGEIQQDLQQIQGVESVDVRFFPPWLNTVPNDNKRITIDFNIDEQ